jgi:hypothetical protein
MQLREASSYVDPHSDIQLRMIDRQGKLDDKEKRTRKTIGGLKK